MSDQYVVERKATIAAPPSEVYERIVDFRRWETWSPWADIDPDMIVTYSGPDQGVGHHYAWSGNKKAGAGSMEITQVRQDQSVSLDLKFLKPMKSEAVITIALAPAGAGTDVTWTMVGPKTLMTRIMGIFKSMDSLVGPDFEKGLRQLKAEAEAA